VSDEVLKSIHNNRNWKILPYFFVGHQLDIVHLDLQWNCSQGTSEWVAKNIEEDRNQIDLK